MNSTEVQTLIDRGSFQSDAPDTVSDYQGQLCINDLIAIPVVTVDCSHDRASDISVTSESGVDFGVLCFCKSSGVPVAPYQALSDWRRVAYLTEASLNDWGTDYHFKSDFLVMNKSNLGEYKENYEVSAPIWGGFSHNTNPRRPTIFRTTTSILARSNCRIPTTHNKIALEYAVQAAHPFDRFLRLYHQLELLFDWIFVKKIHTLGEDLEGISKVMSEYSSGDLPRLKYVTTKFTHDENKLRSKLLMDRKHLQTAELIFNINNKDGNPFKDKWPKLIDWHTQLMTEQAARDSVKIIGNHTYIELLSITSAYWIYRVRCSIAHNRIGEYILKDSDEEFVVEFMEPLLVEILSQVFSHPQLP